MTADRTRSADGPAPRPVARSFRLMLGTAVVFFLALLATSWVASYRDLRRAQERETLLHERIRAAEADNVALVRRIDRLRDDPQMLERLAREQLGMVRPGDVVIVFPEDEVLH